MMQLLFVGDGERDAVTVPTLVEKILTAQIGEEFVPWARLHGSGRGYGHKLLFAIRQARDRKVDGLVATIDRDRDQRGARMKGLREARDKERSQRPAFPAAIGQAIPHGEAWLLDDPVAVQSAMRLDESTSILAVTKTKSPKEHLEHLLGKSQRSGDAPRSVWADIASEVSLARYQNPRATGFDSFAQEVARELGPLKES